ncbi:MAG: aminoacetone oxidase family FAD-binding enzyme [Snowella sp.]|jgi:predicted Rossmann fold flavoprotein|nr:MAG: aminoacetone oxidase family FAD-binding enzyme [Snowella sp.]
MGNIQQQPKIIIIGGGAAGFFAAITAAMTYSRVSITLLEAGREFLSKVRISGGGRCNVTHHCFEPSQLVQYYPRGGKALRGAFSRFQPKDTVAWFKSRDVSLKTEADGRMFPITDDSATIANCLLETAKEYGVHLRPNSPVTSLQKIENQFWIELKNGEILKGDRVLIATGSNPMGYRWAKELGHQVQEPVPSLFTFNIKDARLTDLAGIAVENVRVSLINPDQKKLEQMGPLLITHWGVSGPAILKLSAWGARLLHDQNYQMPLIINWLPNYNRETLQAILLETKQSQPRKQILNFSPVEIPKRLWQSLVTFIGLDTKIVWADLSKKALNHLLIQLLQGEYLIKGKGVFKEEFVTCGGVNLNEINFKTMESKKCPGLFFAGEVLDIDGVTGGFNFQSAWTTGWLAGKGMGII